MIAYSRVASCTFIGIRRTKEERERPSKTRHFTTECTAQASEAVRWKNTLHRHLGRCVNIILKKKYFYIFISLFVYMWRFARPGFLFLLV